MAIDVSVVVPFFNPGANIEDCLASIAGQTLAADRMEAILVDDGSTDGSAERVGEWMSQHPGLATLVRIDASGGPARPRNIGIETARGRYIQFLDSDDALATDALRRQLEVADRSDADVVVGKIASDFRGVWQPLFRRTVTGKTLADYPLIENVTVCKMFRRELLLEHGIRFPEGPRYIEDQQISVRSFAHARSVAVVADTVCYFYRRRRTGGRNRGDTTIVPAEYFRELEEILDVIDTEVDPQARISCLTRYYRGEMLSRLRGAAMLSYDQVYRREMLAEVRRIAVARIPSAVHDNLPMFIRAQSRLLLADELDGLRHLAGELETIRLTAAASAPVWVDGKLVMKIDAYLRHGEEPLRLDRDGDRWLLPEAIAPGVPAEDRDAGSLTETDVDLAAVSRADGQLWSTTDGLTLTIDPEGCARVQCIASIDPATVMGGGPLAAGLWDLRLRVMFGGLTRTSRLHPDHDPVSLPPSWVTGADTGLHSVSPFWSEGSPALVLDVDEWMHPLQEVIDPAASDSATVGRGRSFTLPLRHLKGPAGRSRRAALILEPPDNRGSAPVTCDAVVRLDPDGSLLQATLPRLSGSGAGWAAWLRLGELGSAAARKLPFTLGAGRRGRTVTAASEGGD
jgi:glycosyltransferase involved in cell wall biosynthesis